MSRYVVDASVAAKWFVPEVHTEAALRLRNGHELLAPDLLFPELGNVLWKKVQRAQISRAEAFQILRAIPRLPLAIHGSGTLLAPGLELALGLHRTVYDCLYLALATLRECKLVTADRPLYEAIRQSPYGRHVVWVEDDL